MPINLTSITYNKNDGLPITLNRGSIQIPDDFMNHADAPAPEAANDANDAKAAADKAYAAKLNGAKDAKLNGGARNTSSSIKSKMEKMRKSRKGGKRRLRKSKKSKKSKK